MKKQNQLIAIFSAVFIGLISLISIIIFTSLAGGTNQIEDDSLPEDTFLPTASPLNNNTSPLPTASSELNSNSCQEKQAEELQQCCQQWADENQLFTIQCVGFWEIKDGECAYTCE